MKHLLKTALLTASLACIPACGGAEGEHADHDHDGEVVNAFAEVTKAVCVLKPTEGNTASGTVTFTQTKDGLLVVAEVTGLTPNSKHGFHVHQFADVSAADGTATGGHYNPEGKAHSLPTTEDHGDHDHTVTGGHAGDMGNLEANADGVAIFSVNFHNISLSGPNAILGRSIIVHAKEDDGKGDTGNAGPRIAQGVIGVAKTE